MNQNLELDELLEDELDLPFLSKYSERDAKFDKRKYENILLSELFFQAGLDNRASCLDLCGRDLKFVRKENDIRLKSALFCKDKLCALCNSRRSKIWRNRIVKIIPQIEEKYPRFNISTLVLTVRNPHVMNLSKTLNWMSESWDRMQRLKKFPAIGYILSVEFTRSFNVYFPDGNYIRVPNKDFKTFSDVKYYYRNYDLNLKCRLTTDIHPHFHILLFLPENYYYENYACYSMNIKSSIWLSQRDYQLMWKKFLRINYDPIVWVSAVYPKNPISNNPHFSIRQTLEEDLFDGLI